ncbi:acyloxyacyl hydrolase [Massilia glaciei]|nr:acyloxyacyl hydrolase [Massilia glaciei]
MSVSKFLCRVLCSFLGAGGLGLLPALAMAAPQLDHISLEAGTNSKIRMLRVAVQAHWHDPVATFERMRLTGHWDTSLAYWRATQYRDTPGQKQNITGIGISPVLRLRGKGGTGWYAEAGIGIYLLSRHYDNDGNKLSTRLQFGEQIGFGYVFSNKWEAGLKIQHFSNGSLKRPNNGVNFLLVKVSRPL